MNPKSGFYFWRKREGKVWDIIQISPKLSFDEVQYVSFIGNDDLCYFSDLGGQLGSKIEVPD